MQDIKLQARNEANNIKRLAKRQTWEKLGEDLLKDCEGSRKLVYSVAKSYRKSAQDTVNTIKDKTGILLVDPVKIDSRWGE